MITETEFNKVFKVMVHAVGIKETAFRNLASSKYQSPSERYRQVLARKGIHLRLNKNMSKKLKTEPQMPRGKSNIVDIRTVMTRERNTLHTIEHHEPSNKVTANVSKVSPSEQDSGRKG